jgi:hypothetical protein
MPAHRCRDIHLIELGKQGRHSHEPVIITRTRPRTRDLALGLEEKVDIAGHVECSDIVIGELKASERGLRWMCDDSDCKFCKKG